ncbi:MAG: DUF2933 domain-containing protein [Actinophytocola sp.]|uniref:DUF2933 domain-containing protein n=1 Tax=Actinophytocola sp. TaxID=1872138 RepID=UPI001328C3B2|nr:DUF2933 domain-containing protein [Actinophytocola sp.]MPZ84476.1 DUF2933 domain-containing protein [Actinophytocola sp.]
MNRQHLPQYAIALAILIVGLAFAGVPVSTLLVGLAALACPLMMMFMMGGMHGGGHGGSDQNTGHSGEQDRDHRPTSGRP